MSDPILTPPEPPLAAPGQWYWPFAIGLALIALAVFSFYRAFFSLNENPMLIGLFMLIGGVAEGILAIFGRAFSEFVRDLAPALLYIVIGIVIMTSPATGSFYLTLILAVAFTAGAVYRAAAWFQDRPLVGWHIIAVMVAVGIAVWLLLGWTWPRSGLWVLGTVAGVGLLVTGWSWVERGWTARAARDVV